MSEVLICDDSSVERKILDRIVQKMGHNSTLVDSGEKAILECQEQQFDLIFLDLLMPNMDGWEVAKAIRQIESYETTPIIAISSVKNKLDQERVLFCGMNQLVAKPFEKADIETIINNVLDKEEV